MKNLTIILFLSLSILSCRDTFFEEEPINEPEEIFEDMWNTFDTDYAVFEERGIDWQDEYNNFRPLVTSRTSQEELYTIFTQLLGKLNDGHVSLVAPNKKVFNSNSYFDQNKRDGLFNMSIIKSNYLKGNFIEEFEGHNIYGKIDDIGYWHMKFITENLENTDAILNYMEDTKGLIIDLRNNQGGDMTYSFTSFGRLTEIERPTHRSKTKNGPGENDFTPWYDWNLYPETPYFDKPIVMITDRYTISAGERTTMILKTLPNVIHIGDTTNGSLSTKIGKELANGWYYSVSPQKIEFIDGRSYEGIGLIPDVYVKNTLEEIASGQDRTLELAIAEFME